MDAPEPFVSVIIPTYRDSEVLAGCLAALAHQTYPSSRFEVIVVNNDPAESLNGVPTLAGNGRIVVEAQPGSYAARNRGIADATGELIAFTDADCLPAEDWLECAVKQFRASPDLDRIAGHVEVVANDESNPSPADLYERVYGFRQERYVRKFGAGATANLIVKASAFGKVGTFDSSLFSGGDIEWGIRATGKGLSIMYAEEVRVRHPARASYPELIRKMRRVGGGRYRPSPRSFLAAHLRWLAAFVSPLVDFPRALSVPSLTLKQRIMTLLLRWHLSFVHAWARLRVAYGRPAERR